MKTSVHFITASLAFLSPPFNALAEPDCDNSGDGKECKKDCSEETKTMPYGEECPSGYTEINPIILKSGNSVRKITDLRIPAHNHGGRALSFTRRNATRYIGLVGNGGSALTSPFASGGNWRHNWHYVITRGGPHPTTAHETLVIDAPDGTQTDFTKPNLSQTYMTARSWIHERIEKDATNPDLYRLWYADGSHVRINRYLDAGGQEYFLATAEVDPHGLTYALNYLLNPKLIPFVITKL